MAGPGHQGRLQWRRLSAELVVISLGVFLGLAADTAWEARQDAAREVDYLRQLDEDLRATETELGRAIEEQQEIDRVADLAIEGINAAVLPPEDSVALWVRGLFGASRFEPTMGTVVGLIQTGDMRLLSDQQLRSDLLRYMQAAESFLASGGRFLEQRLRAIEDLGRVISLDALPGGQGVAHPRVPPDWDSAADSPAFHSAVRTLRNSSRLRSQFLLTFQGQFEKVREGLDRELTAQGVSDERP